MENPCDKSFIRGAAAALVRPVATSAVALLRSGTAFMSIFPQARASEARAVRQRANDHSLWRAGATSAGATSIVGKDFLPAIAPKGPLLGRAMGVVLRDDGIVPLICPTCQNVFAGSLKASIP